MYKVLLVDDENVIRESIARRIAWKQEGFELAGSCENGKEAIALLENQTVDLLITDICMPYVDGLELIQYVYENKKSRKYIIISGYSEFEYAKRALQYRVHTYLLKPVTAVELTRILREVKNALDAEETEEVPDKKIFLRELLKGGYTDETQKSQMCALGLEHILQDKLYTVVFVYPPNEKKADPLLKEMVNRWEEVVIAERMEDAIVLLCTAENTGLMKSLINDVKNYFGETKCMISIGNTVNRMEEVVVSYENAINMKEFHFLEKNDCIYDWDTYQQAQKKMPTFHVEKKYSNRIILAIRGNLKHEIQATLQMLCEESRKNWYRKSQLIVICQRLVLDVLAKFEHLCMEDPKIYKRSQETIDAIYQCETIGQMLRLEVEFFEWMSDVKEVNRENSGERQAAMALDYIEAQYVDPELSMQTICKELDVSVSYFSIIFKNYTGKTFVEVLTERRMKAAKELLEHSNMKNYEIAQRCGYQDASYFSSTFKKHVKMTPREYIRFKRGYDE